MEEVTARASIVVPGLPECVKQRLAAQAKAHGRSMEAEGRAILKEDVQKPHIGKALLEVARRHNDTNLTIPARDHRARAVDDG